MSKFKVGDRVRVIHLEESSDLQKEGDEFIIDHISEGKGDGNWYFRNQHQLGDYFYENEIDLLYRPSPATLGDVTITTTTASTAYNVGNSDYSKRKIQPWMIWEEYELNPWDADIVKRVLRTKEGESRQLDYEKIIHICKYRIEKLEKSVD